MLLFYKKHNGILLKIKKINYKKLKNKEFLIKYEYWWYNKIINDFFNKYYKNINININWFILLKINNNNSKLIISINFYMIL